MYTCSYLFIDRGIVFDAIHDVVCAKDCGKAAVGVGYCICYIFSIESTQGTQLL